MLTDKKHFRSLQTLKLGNWGRLNDAALLAFVKTTMSVTARSCPHCCMLILLRFAVRSPSCTCVARTTQPSPTTDCSVGPMHRVAVVLTRVLCVVGSDRQGLPASACAGHWRLHGCQRSGPAQAARPLPAHILARTRASGGQCLGLLTLLTVVVAFVAACGRPVCAGAGELQAVPLPAIG